MYKVLVTTRGGYSVANGAAYQIRTDVLEFTTSQEAVSAAGIINAQTQTSYLQQKALPLFECLGEPNPDPDQVLPSLH